MSRSDVVSVKWVIFGGLEVGISLLRDDIQKGLEIEEMLSLAMDEG